MQIFFHVSSTANRESIRKHGLDWNRMGAAPGIAGSRTAEQKGCFLSPDAFTADFFIRMNNTGGPVDVWEVTGVDPDLLVESPEGFLYFPGVIPPDRVRLKPGS